MSLVLVGAANGPARADLVINEILVDPDGSDGGREFVELYNPGPGAVALEGVRFEFANGAEEETWRLRWEGQGLPDLPAGRFFLLTDRNWQGEAEADADAYLGLQNGPDAVRLVRGETTLDLLGYGALTDPALFEGDPAAVATGRSLARRPDGADSGVNSADFVLADPTPGAVNFRDWAVETVACSFDPPSLDRLGAAVGIAATIRNVGAEHGRVRDGRDLGGRAIGDRTPGSAAQRGEAEVFWSLRIDSAGALPVRLLILPPAVPDTLELELGSLQIGPGPLVLDEVLAAPDQGQGEWIELRARVDSLDLARFRLRDEDGDWRTLPSRTLARG